MTTSYTVAYWMGGSANGMWKRCVPVSNKAEAIAQATSIVRAGRAAYVYNTAMLNIIGLPDDAPPTWDFANLCWLPGCSMPIGDHGQ
jgi:hypothetical protein